MLRRILINGFIVLLIVILGLFAALYISFYTPVVTKKIIRNVLSQQLPQFRIEKLNIRRQSFIFPQELILHGVALKLRQNKEGFEFIIDEIEFKSLLKFIKKKTPLQIVIRQAQFKSQDIVLENIRAESFIEQSNSSKFRLKGTAAVDSATFFSYKLEAIKAAFSVDESQVQMTSLIAKCYGGTIKGDMQLELRPQLNYSANFLLDHLLLSGLQKVNQVYAAVEGKVSGQVNLSGRGQKMDSISLDLAISESGKIKSEFLGFLVQYVPTINFDKEKMKLFKGSSMIPFEKGTVQLKNLNDNQLSGLIVLESKKLNMNFNINPTINVEGGLFRSFQTLLNFSENQTRR